MTSRRDFIKSACGLLIPAAFPAIVKAENIMRIRYRPNLTTLHLFGKLIGQHTTATLYEADGTTKHLSSEDVGWEEKVVVTSNNKCVVGLWEHSYQRPDEFGNRRHSFCFDLNQLPRGDKFVDLRVNFGGNNDLIYVFDKVQL